MEDGSAGEQQAQTQKGSDQGRQRLCRDHRLEVIQAVDTRFLLRRLQRIGAGEGAVLAQLLEPLRCQIAHTHVQETLTLIAIDYLPQGEMNRLGGPDCTEYLPRFLNEIHIQV